MAILLRHRKPLAGLGILAAPARHLFKFVSIITRQSGQLSAHEVATFHMLIYTKCSMAKHGSQSGLQTNFFRMLQASSCYCHVLFREGSMISTRQFEAGEVIFRENDIGETAYVIE